MLVYTLPPSYLQGAHFMEVFVWHPKLLPPPPCLFLYMYGLLSLFPILLLQSPTCVSLSISSLPGNVTSPTKVRKKNLTWALT